MFFNKKFVSTLIALIFFARCIPAGVLTNSNINLNALSENENHTISKDLILNGSVIEITGNEFTSGYGVALIDLFEGKKNILTTSEDSHCVWEFYVPEEGHYFIQAEYFPLQGRGIHAQRAISFNGEPSFGSWKNILFPRIFIDETPVIRNEDGNDLRPRQIEKPKWINSLLKDNRGYGEDPLYFYFPKGYNSIRFDSIQEPIAISKLILRSEELILPEYNEVIDLRQSEGAKIVQGQIDEGIKIVQAEYVYQKSDPTLHAIPDSSSPYNQPYSYRFQKLNVIGGARWETPGQWISWQVDVPESGFYNIGLRYKLNDAQSSMRILYIDDEIPFKEASQIQFKQGNNWQVKLLGGEEEYLFYLEQGVRTIKLQVTLGEMGENIRLIEDVIRNLNSANWELMTYIGVNPDTFRDFDIEHHMPHIIETFSECANELKTVSQNMVDIYGEIDFNIAEINQLITSLNTMVRSPHRIPAMFAGFRDSVNAFGDLVTRLRRQPLLLDYLFIFEAGADIPKANAGILTEIRFGILRFINSFLNDYNEISSQYMAQKSSEIKVWIGSGIVGGRDQAQALNQLILQDFSINNDVNVRLQLVPPGTVLTATLAGKGPDIAINVNAADPVNYAMRNAVVDLKKFEDFQNVKKYFNINAFTGFEYQGGIFALPETMFFPMMFYRTDILERIGINIEDIKTWDDVIGILLPLQSNNMNFGLPAILSNNISVAFNTYYMFLFQMGGEIYRDDGRYSNLDDITSLNAFVNYMKFYTHFGTPFIYNFETRFRSGEIPIAISDYTTYNLLQISAPEISGLWGMTTVPGYKTPDGEVDITAPISGAATVMFSTTQNQVACWEFMKWWVSSDTQYDFGKELESVMGIGARYNTANIEAMQRLPWSSDDRIVLLTQMDSLKGIKEVPGGYMTPRNLDFAIKAVYNRNLDARRELLSQIEQINQELLLKRLEFGIE